MDDVQNMKTPLLMENFRALIRGAALATNANERDRLSMKADLYEEEILRRMAW